MTPMERDRWHRAATVRAAAQRRWDPHAEGTGRLFFSTSHVPVAGHLLLRERLEGPQWRELHIQHFYRFMALTIRLEQYVVNPAVLALAHREVPVELRDEDIHGAHRIYVDEGYHALEAVELMSDVRHGTGVAPVIGGRAGIDRRLEEVLADLPDGRTRALARQLFVVVSETMISATLSAVPHDEEVVDTVRAAIADHAVDEGRHHRFFAAYLPRLWGGLGTSDRDLLAPLLPRFMSEFTAPDLAGLRRELIGYGLSRRVVDTVCEESYSSERLRAETAATGAATLRYLQECGALGHGRMSDALGAAGLLP